MCGSYKMAAAIIQEFKIPRTKVVDPRWCRIAQHCLVTGLKPNAPKIGTHWGGKGGVEAYKPFMDEIESELQYLKDVYDPQLLFCRLIALGDLPTVRDIMTKDCCINTTILNKLHKMYPREYVSFNATWSNDFILKVDVNTLDGDGRSPLNTALEFQHVDLVKYLLRNRANPDAEDGNGDTPQDFLSKYEEPKKTEIKDALDKARLSAKPKKTLKKKTLKKKTLKKKRCPNGTRRNKVGECVSSGKKDTSKKECPPGKVLNPTTNRCNKKKKTLKPCPPGKERNPKTNRCRNLIQPKSTKATPKQSMSYFDAIQKDDIETVQALVNQHSDLSVTNEDGNTPLMYILGDRHAGDLREFFDVLAEASKDTLSHKNNEGDNALLMACYTCIERYIQKLIDLGADLNAKNSNGQTAEEVLTDDCGLSPSDFKKK